jgi:DNA-binding NarL/FixJ family response regulator
MSQWGVQIVIGKLVADATFRHRFETSGHETLAKLCEQGIDLSDTEVAAFLDMDRHLWAVVAATIDRRLRPHRFVGPARPAVHRPSGVLTPRQREVLRGVFEGYSNKQIAIRIGVSESAIKATLQQLFRKMGVRTRAQLVLVVIEGTPVAPPDGATAAMSPTRTKERAAK